MQRFIKLVIVVCAGLALAGCVTEKEAKARERAAYVEGEKRGLAAQKESNVVWVVGNVKVPLVTWIPELTLAKAIVAADYLNTADPSLIEVFRNGQAPVIVSPKQILKGFDMPLQPGDRIEIRP